MTPQRMRDAAQILGELGNGKMANELMTMAEHAEKGTVHQGALAAVAALKQADAAPQRSDICPMSGKVHSPVIVSRCGGPTPKELNHCGICGSELTMVRGKWIAISDEQSDAIRERPGA